MLAAGAYRRPNSALTVWEASRVTTRAAAKPVTATAAEPKANMRRWLGLLSGPTRRGTSPPTSRGNVTAAMAPGASRAIWATVAAAAYRPRCRPEPMAGQHDVYRASAPSSR